VQRSWLRLFWLTVVLVGVLAGYLVSSGLGTRLLHREIETQLSRLAQGPVEISSVEVHFRDGLQVEAREVSAYPSPIAGDPPILRARRVLAWVDFLALLIGRLELSTLILEGPHIRLVQHADGSFAGLPIPAPSSYPDEGLENRSPAEQIFVRLSELDALADRAAEDFQVADAVEIVDGTVEWIGPPSHDESKTSIRVELLNGRAERNWLNRAVAIDATGVFIDRVHAPFPFEIGVHRAEGPHFVWSLALSQIPLDAAENPLSFIEGIARLEGRLDTRFTLRSEPGGLHRLTVAGTIEDATIDLHRTATRLEHERVDLAAELVIDPVEIRLQSARVAGPRLGLLIQGALQRPIRGLSPLRVEIRTEGIELRHVRDYARGFEGESETALTISRLTDRVISGRVHYVEAAGTAPLDRWRNLLSGKGGELPEGLVFSGAFDSVTVESGPNDRIEDLAAEVEWIDDQIVFREGRGVYRGEPLPELNMVVNGISHLVRTRPEDRRINLSPPPLPGLEPLFEILAPRDPDSLPPIKAIGLAIDALEHPVLRWPIEELRVLIEPLRRGLELTIRDGLWGGARVSGELVWFTDPEAPSLSATLTLDRAVEKVPTGEEGEAADAPRLPENVWGQAQFEMEFRPRPWLPFERAEGFLRFEDTQVSFNELDIKLMKQGTMAARMVLDLDSTETVGFDVSFAETGGRLQEIGPFVALPPGLAEGEIDLSGSMIGRVRPHKNFIANLTGSVRGDARAGKVASSLPLMFRLAKATEGYNPFANSDELSYETMEGTFKIDRGLISVEDFEIEGPLRVYARADIDTLDTPGSIRGVVGIFLFRKPNQLLESLPLVRAFLPGSERGLIGTYFRVNGPLNEPEVDALPLQSLMTSVPDIIKAPFKVLGSLFDGSDDDS